MSWARYQEHLGAAEAADAWLQRDQITESGFLFKILGNLFEWLWEHREAGVGQLQYVPLSPSSEKISC